MSIKVGARLTALVTDALMRSPIPLRTSEIARQTGRSVTAVKSALEASSAEKIPDVTPTEWALPASVKDNSPRIVPTRNEGVELLVGAKKISGVVTSWNANREALGVSLSGLEITPSSDPKKLALQLGTVAGSIASLAYELSQVQGLPDWYAILTDEG